MALSVDRLQRAVVLAVAVICAGLAATSLWPIWSELGRVDMSLDEFARFDAALQATSTLSAERGPANKLMGAPLPHPADLVAELTAARAATDERLARLQVSFSGEFAASADLRAAFGAVTARLTSARAEVDAAVRHDPEGDAIDGAIGAMFAASDQMKTLRDRLGEAVIANADDLSGEIVLATLASNLREHAGRLGSHVVMLLAPGPGDDRPHALSIEIEAARVGDLDTLLRSSTPPTLMTPAFRQALTAMQTAYFGRALPYARGVAAAPPDGTDIVDFTKTYVPGMASVVAVQTSIVETTKAALLADRDRARTALGLGAALAALALAALATLAVLLRKGLFEPFLAVRRQITAIAEGDLGDPIEPRAFGSEVRDMFKQLDELRRQQRVRRRLEQERHHIAERLRHLSQLDSLTGVYNRRALNEMAAQILEQDGAGSGLAVIMLDIDHFKSINDRHGHLVGDRVLQSVAERLSAHLPEGSILARFGGEEFLIILRHVTRDEAASTAENLRRLLSETCIEGLPALAVTGSFGVAWMNEAAALTWEDLVTVADNRLYDAKRAGRDRVHAEDNNGDGDEV